VELSTSVSLMMSFRFSETPQFRLAGDITSFTALRISYVPSRLQNGTEMEMEMGVATSSMGSYLEAGLIVIIIVVLTA
jgi:hypothetical protein